MPDAKVACRQLGFTKTVGASYDGRGTAKIWLYNMGCSGSEFSLGSCPHNGWGSVASWCNSHNDDAGVVWQAIFLNYSPSHCSSLEDVSETQTTKKVNRSLQLEEVYHQGQWGTVCRYNWNMPDAKVACRQLGFTKTVGPSRYGRGTGKIWLDEMQCTGTEVSLGSCSHDGWGNVYSYCNGHTRDAGVV
ncbi:scavenger receptor cysteine-rich type 1 protein M130-like [Actinia tenebrosa]|uniref:Scavenger receptor cysteine-rich type 1 protein M130-like n=1 Tax=Actinia tenebrosa TaxID=6105 RepID=A0A6P8J3C0_ACTTE|nr:scavenger receptor cysteine-rich type 1 protein M130-like [Actinia tenebrosa]